MTGKRIVFCTFGSLGDLYPFVALAHELKHRGHTPVIATPGCYRNLIEGEGIEYHRVRPDADPNDPETLRRVMDPHSGAKFIFGHIMDALSATYQDTATAAENADLLVTHPLAL